MKAPTLTDYVSENIKNDSEFAVHYGRERLITEIAIMITSARKEHRMTQAELAKRLGIKQSVISRIENGQGAAIPSIEILVKIGAVLNRKIYIQFQNAH